MLRFRLNDLLPGLVQAFADPPRRSAWMTSPLFSLPLVDRASLPTPSNVESSAALNKRAPMIVDLVLEAGITCGVGARLTLQYDRRAVRHDQPGPDQQHARLAERDLAVIDADQARPLRDEKIIARSACHRHSR